MTEKPNTPEKELPPLRVSLKEDAPMQISLIPMTIYIHFDDFDDENTLKYQAFMACEPHESSFIKFTVDDMPRLAEVTQVIHDIDQTDPYQSLKVHAFVRSASCKECDRMIPEDRSLCTYCTKQLRENLTNG